MPMKTTPRTGRSASARTASTWSTISQVSRLRRNPMCPVMQKSHAIAQPTCVDTHSTYLSSNSGMRTASTRPPSGDSNRYLTKPSSARRRSTTASAGKLARPST